MAGVLIIALLYNSPLLCSFNVPIKGLNSFMAFSSKVMAH